MNYKMIGRIISQIIGVETAFMLLALLVSAYYREGVMVRAFACGIALQLVVAGILYLLSRGPKLEIHPRDGLVCVAMGWIGISVLGCLPFVFSGAIPSFIDALFEMVSGFTTTGASILTDVECLPRGALYWRSFSHWLGGMGVLVFVLAVIPVSSRGNGFTMNLLRAESPGPTVGKLVPRIKQTATILYMLYVILTVVDVVFLLAGGMPVFDAVCTAFGTAGTGGFGIRNDSIAGYSPYIQNVCTVFMLLFGVNFNCFYLILMRKFAGLFRDEELRLYLAIALCSILLIAYDIRGIYSSLGETLRHSAFQVSSIMTTTGFATTNFDEWPSFSKSILLLLMLIGACAGSTGGGIKCSRVVILFKDLRRNIRQVLNPQDVQVVRNSGHVIDEKVLGNTNAYLSAYVIIVIASIILISLNEMSMTTNLTAVIACFNNIGPGLEMVGPNGNYAAYGVLSKLILIFDMLAGRLEIFPILVLFSLRTWRKW